MYIHYFLEVLAVNALSGDYTHGIQLQEYLYYFCHEFAALAE
jgi:hypothetical protein